MLLVWTALESALDVVLLHYLFDPGALHSPMHCMKDLDRDLEVLHRTIHILLRAGGMPHGEG